jgi:hypothetical protein
MNPIARGIEVLCTVLFLVAAASGSALAGGPGGQEFVGRLLDVCKSAAANRSLSVRLGCAEVADDAESAASLAPTLQAEACRTIDAHCTGTRGGSGVDAFADRLGCDPGATPRCLRQAGKSEPEFDLCGGRMRIEYFRETKPAGEPNWALGLAWKDGSRWYMSEHFIPPPDPRVLQQWMRRNSRGGSAQAGYGLLVKDIVARNCESIEDQLRKFQRERSAIQKLNHLLMDWMVKDMSPGCSTRATCFPATGAQVIGPRG